MRGEILGLLLRLREELGLTVLVVTHDLGLAWNIADRVAVMYLGRIVEIGPTAEVLEAPLHPYTQALLSVVPDVSRSEQIVLQGETPDPARIPSGCRFHPRCPVVMPECASVTLPILGIDRDGLAGPPGQPDRGGSAGPPGQPDRDGLAGPPGHIAACLRVTS